MQTKNELQLECCQNTAVKKATKQNMYNENIRAKYELKKA